MRRRRWLRCGGMRLAAGQGAGGNGHEDDAGRCGPTRKATKNERPSLRWRPPCGGLRPAHPVQYGSCGNQTRSDRVESPHTAGVQVERTEMRAYPRTMIAIAVTTGVLAGCAKAPAGGASGAHPPKLHIGTGAQTAAGAAAVAPMPAGINGAAVRGGPDIDPGFTGFGGYVLTGTLPDGPTHAAVWRLSATQATKDEIAKLGALVGVTGTPQRHAPGWLLSSAAGEVRVSDRGGHQWSFIRAD